MPLTLEQLNQHAANSPFIAWCGMTVTEANSEAGTLTMTMPLRPEFERAAGSGQIHGGPIAALIDTAGCFALVMVQETGIPTVNFRTDYLRPAVRTALHARACVRRVGRTVGLVDVDVLNDDDTLVAVGRGTFGTSAG